jgi:aminocarboxymuconate-semialdehyde decarboxylase
VLPPLIETTWPVMISGKPFRKVVAAAWDGGLRQDDMARSAVDVQVVSPMPELLSYWLSADDGAAMCDFLNQEIGALVRSAPQRFIGLGAVPLQDPERACRALEQIMRDDAFRGVEIGSNINGVPIGDASFAEFFAIAERLGAAIFVHALKPIGDERITGPMSLRAVLSFPCEISFAIGSAITGGLLSRHPRLRIAFSHGGGAFAAVLPRLQHAWRSIDSIRALVAEDPVAIARRLYFDTLVYSPQLLGHLVGQLGIDRFLAGSDFPFDIAEREPVRSLRAALSPADADAIVHDNPERFLGMRAQAAGAVT